MHMERCISRCVQQAHITTNQATTGTVRRLPTHLHAIIVTDDFVWYVLYPSCSVSWWIYRRYARSGRIRTFVNTELAFAANYTVWVRVRVHVSNSHNCVFLSFTFGEWQHRSQWVFGLDNVLLISSSVMRIHEQFPLKNLDYVLQQCQLLASTLSWCTQAEYNAIGRYSHVSVVVQCACIYACVRTSFVTSNTRHWYNW